MGQVPAFQLTALLRVRRWSRWSRLYGVWVLGSCLPGPDTLQDQGGRGSCSWRHTGPPGLGSQSWCSSWQPLSGRFLWGRIYWLRDRAPCGTRVQTYGNFMSGPWTGRGGSRWPTPRESTVYETCLRLEVEAVCRMVLFSQRRPPEMPDQSRVSF